MFKKNTKIFKIGDSQKFSGAGDLAAIDEAALLLSKGGLVAFPTETVYGLGANALDGKAVKKVYKAKGRPSDNPMIVHIARASDIGAVTAMLSPTIVTLIEQFWPGPLTLVVKKKDIVPKETTGGLDTVAVRMPDNPIALELINKAGCPVAAPSANISGKPSPTKGEHVVDDLNGIIDGIVIGDDCRVGIESTVLDVTGDVLTILRPGIITAADISVATKKKVVLHPSLLEKEKGEETTREVVEDGLEFEVDCFEDEMEQSHRSHYQNAFVPKSPGMKYKHYAPKADMLVIEGQREKVKKEIERLKVLNERLGNKVGVILFEEKAFVEAASKFFSQLRELDKEEVDLILAGALSDTDGVGFAVMNRMMKAAGYNVVKV